MDLARLDDVRRTTRRLLLRRRRLLSALLLGVAVLTGIRAVAPPDPSTVPVVVAAHDLASGELLEASDLTTVALPEGVVPAGVVDVAYAVGRVTTGPIRRGEPLTEVRFVGESILAGYAGLVAVPVRIPDAQATALLRVGDHIDLLGTDSRSGDTQSVGSNFPVIALPQLPASSQTIRGEGRLIVVGTTPELSREVASAATAQYLTIVIPR